MKTRICVGFAAALVVLGGCVVKSVYPYYTEKDLIFDPGLVGSWQEVGTNSKPSEFVRIERSGQKGYICTAFAENETNSVEVHLFKLKGQLFIDTYATNRSLDFVPVHQLSRVVRMEPNLEVCDLNYQWLEELVKKSPREIRHVEIPDRSQGNDSKWIVLTADTARLQKFVLRYLKNDEAWTTPSTWQRRK